MKLLKSKYEYSGFSIVELLVTIVVIAILATITAVSFTSVSKRAAGESVKSDLQNASSVIAKHKANYGAYPATIDCSLPNSSTNECVKASSGDIQFKYNVNTVISPNAYALTAIKNNDSSLSYRTANGTDPVACPVGYIVVPGSTTYGTSSFCVMKYEASHIDTVGNTQGSSSTSISQVNATPWVNINQTSAVSAAKTSCTDCHLITEAEWMTLARNVLSVGSNWNSGIVGTGYIYNGHNDNAPTGPVLSVVSDSNGYDNVTNSGGKQRRTLTLTNGEVIWDLAGNVSEWTAGVSTSGAISQPGVSGNAYTSWVEWPSLTITPGSLTVNTTPLGTGISLANTWNNTYGIGQLYSNPADVVQRGLVRGGYWNGGVTAGVLSLAMNNLPSAVSPSVGFRAAR